MIYFRLFLFGFLFGPIGDFFHIKTQVIAYSQDVYLWPWSGPPQWVPFYFGFLAVLIGVTHVLFYNAISKTPTHLFKKTALSSLPYVALGIFITSYSLMAYLPWSTGGNDLLILLVCLGIWFFFNRTLAGFILGIITSLVGCCVEVAFVKLGIFEYLIPNKFLGVPTWLPWIYFLASQILTYYSFSRSKMLGNIQGSSEHARI